MCDDTMRRRTPMIGEVWTGKVSGRIYKCVLGPDEAGEYVWSYISPSGQQRFILLPVDDRLDPPKVPIAETWVNVYPNPTFGASCPTRARVDEVANERERLGIIHLSSDGSVEFIDLR